MIRNLFRLAMLLVVFLIIRSLIVSVWNFLSGTEKVPHGPDTVRAGGELKKDPVCGTFVSVHTSVSKQIGGEMVHFCSAACRDKYRVA